VPRVAVHGPLRRSIPPRGIVLTRLHGDTPPLLTSFACFETSARADGVPSQAWRGGRRPALRASAIRPPAVAGLFYPASARALSRAVDALLSAAPVGASAGAPKAVIAPHAGFDHSGPVAAAAYSRLWPLRGKIRRVILLGPAHRVPFRGMALPGASAFRTPLGDVRLDAAAVARLKALPGIRDLPAAHAAEHSLEVHLPFLQRVLAKFALIPLLVDDAEAAEVAAVLDALWDGAETLVVVSSDLSHGEPYFEARAHDPAPPRPSNGSRAGRSAPRMPAVASPSRVCLPPRAPAASPA
jgi:hypothetical protein